ncbi:unnamed protein product [Chrysoparadoxa australica]
MGLTETTRTSPTFHIHPPVWQPLLILFLPQEVDFHLKSESMNSAALWWPMIQVAVLLVFGVMHVRHLKAFFKGKKLI